MDCIKYHFTSRLARVLSEMSNNFLHVFICQSFILYRLIISYFLGRVIVPEKLVANVSNQFCPRNLYFVCYKCISNILYSKFSKLSKTFLFLFVNKMLVIRTETHKKLVRKANREDSDQTDSSEAV